MCSEKRVATKEGDESIRSAVWRNSTNDEGTALRSSLSSRRTRWTCSPITMSVPDECRQLGSAQEHSDNHQQFGEIHRMTNESVDTPCYESRASGMTREASSEARERRQREGSSDDGDRNARLSDARRVPIHSVGPVGAMFAATIKKLAMSEMAMTARRPSRAEGLVFVTSVIAPAKTNAA